ncbi:MAG TPA: hypothetical protein VED40_11815 [Azospirillaceae bacterium]|nr:hypothetical protein [Azospirillaceae bacterium]
MRSITTIATPLALAALLVAGTALAQQPAPRQPAEPTAQQPPGAAVPKQPTANKGQPNWPGGQQNPDQSSRVTKGGKPGEAKARGLTDQDVKASQDPMPTAQGTRPATELEGGTKDPGQLHAALNRVWDAPPGITDGKPVARPNELARQPMQVLPPDQRRSSLFAPGYIE